jgi:hypothetical protein
LPVSRITIDVRRFAAVAAAAALLGLAAAAAAPARAAVPTGLPSHFAIGLAGHPDATGIYGWMPNSQIPFDYAYQYLAAGVNTGSGWQTWNENAQFPLWYAQGAAARGYIPVFPYYMLLQSNGTCGSCGEAQKDLSNLDNPSTMNAYYADFAKLMQRLGNGTHDAIAGFGGTAVVHVEPDLSGYAQQAVLDNTKCYSHCTGTGNDPALLKAAVASSGHAAVAGYPNTYKGFSEALAHLRDLYAPNVLLAFHVSNWAVLHDVGSNTDPALDVTALGTKAGAFAAAAGGGYELVFNDVADRDAGYYKYVLGRDAFWDRNNVRLPHFRRWEQFVSAVTQTAGRPMLVWQVPLGNQWFQTMNNSDGHYQDNRAEYFFSHLAELRDAGIVGLLFGAGNAGSTTNDDGKADGVTNPASFCSTDGISSASICNNHASTSADDDGGFLRMQSAAYFQNPLALDGGGASSAPVVSGASAAPSPFSPDGDGTRDATTISYSLSAAADVMVTIRSAAGTVVRTLASAAPRASGPSSEPWNGRNASGAVVADGSYTVTISATNASGTSAAATATVAVDLTAPAAPVVKSPSKATSTPKATTTISGTAAASSLVRAWVDANANGRRDSGEALAGSQQLAAAATSWSLSVALATGPNRFVVTATDAAGNTSAATAVAVITRR